MAAILMVTALQLKLPAGHPMGVTAKSGAVAVEATVEAVTAVMEAETATVADGEVTAGTVVGVTAPFGWTNMVHQPVLTTV